MHASTLLPLLSVALVFALANGGAVQYCSDSSPSGDCPNVAEHSLVNTADRGDYYLLSVSWTPTFCCYGPGKKNKNCDECAFMHQQNYPFYLHGLWPQCANPERGTFLGQCCVPDKWSEGITGDPVMYKACKDNVVDVLGWCDSPVLGGGEWPRHGTCSGLDAPTYFKVANEAFKFVKDKYLTTLADMIFNAPRVRKNKGLQSYIQLEDLLSVFPEGSIREVNIPKTGVVDELRICFQKKAGSSEPDISLEGMNCGDQELLTQAQDLFFAIPCVTGYNGQCENSDPSPPNPNPNPNPTPNPKPTPKPIPEQSCQIGKSGPACKTDQDCCQYGSCKRCSRNSKKCTAEPGYDACRGEF